MSKWLTVGAIVVALIVAAICVVSYMPGMMYPGMTFSGGAYNRPVYAGWGGAILDRGQVAAYLRQAAETGTADLKANTVTYSGKDVTIDLVAVQPSHKDQTFEVRGLVNPILVVPRGATVHLTLVNMDYGDNMEHSVVVTSVPPPYPYMAMMTIGHGIAAIVPLLPWRSSEDVQQARYASLNTTFVAEKPGTYWYVCPTPNHAEAGMYGKFIVQ